MAININRRLLWMTQLALLTALVIVLQMLPVRAGAFQFALALVPIIIGGALFGAGAGAWLGFVFGLVILLNGDAAAFMAVSVPGTIITIMARGLGAGAAGGLIYRLLEKRTQLGAVISSSIVVPAVNTGMFILGCLIFFMPFINEIAAGLSVSGGMHFLIFGMIGVNFFVELGSTVLLSGAALQIIKIAKRKA